ncbi:MAG: FtsK/SpoIIIE domain-containing protein, partial [Dolichospermum sp.]
NLKLLDIVNLYGSSPRRNIIDIQNRFFQSLLREPITISLRYFYNPSAISNDKCLEIFLIFNTESEDISKRISSALQTSDFHQIYPFQTIEFNTFQSQTLQNLDWVNSLLEIHKAEIISDKGYYLPRPFSANNEHDMVAVCEQLSRICKISPERFLLEITLQPYKNSAESSQWMKAIDTLLKVPSQAGNSGKDAMRETVIKGFESYQTKYSDNPVFTYSIKLLAETENHLSNLATTWLYNATSSEYANYYQNLPILKRGSTEFQKSLQATCEVQISPRSSNNSSVWQQISDQTIHQIFSPKPLFGDASTQRSKYVPPPTPPNSSALPNPTTTPKSSSSLTSGSSHALTTSFANQGWHRPQPPRIEDFLPLRYLVTFEEFSSFLRVVVPDPQPISCMAILQPSYPIMTDEELFNNYRHLITPDTYIVGLDDKGNVIPSSWDTIPHRLLAGTSGAGKTNFLRWLLFQFLYVNPKRKIYIADFQGVDFQFLAHLGVNVNLVTTVEDCETQIETINNEEFLARQQLMNKYNVTRLSTLQQEGVDIDHTLWLIDEAADIAYASSKLRTKIEDSLAKIARQGRKPAIHVVYCTQRVSTTVITPQVTDQCQERVVFKVTANASEIVLEDSSASEIPMDAKGRAILDSPQGRMFINTPFMQNPEGS